MKKLAFILICCALAVGCAYGPVISKSAIGNLEINVLTSDGEQITTADVYLDGLFVGNVTDHFPVIHARRGERLVRVECKGHKSFERKITVLGDPNHQVLNIILEKEL